MRNLIARFAPVCVAFAAVTSSTVHADNTAAVTQVIAAAERQWATFDVQSSRCAWATHAVSVLQRREIALQRALGKLNQPPVIVPPPAVAAGPCDSAEHEAMAGKATVTAWEWLTRLDFHSSVQNREGWHRGVVNLGGYVPGDWSAYQAALERSLVKANSREAIDARRDTIRQEETAVLVLMCRERRPQATDCPALPAGFAGQEPAGRARLAELERAGAQLAGTANDRDSIDAIGRAWRLQTDPADTSAICKEDDRVIFPHVRETSRGAFPNQILVQLRKWGWMVPANAATANQVAAVEVTPDGYTLLSSGELKVHFNDKVKRKFIACEAF